MIRKPTIFLTILFFCRFASGSYQELIPLDFGNFTLHYNCAKRGYEWFYFEIGQDKGDQAKSSLFVHDVRLPERCRQFSTETYQSELSGVDFIRGHGINPAVLDHQASLMQMANFMSNIVPHASRLISRGAWYKTELLTECWRKSGKIKVWGGVIWGDNKRNDYFKKTHGVVTPDALWKVVQFPDGDVNAWIIPNRNSAKASKLDSYLVAPVEVATRTSVPISIEDASELAEADTISKELLPQCVRS